MDLDIKHVSEDVEGDGEFLGRNNKFGGAPPHAPQNSTVALTNDGNKASQKSGNNMVVNTGSGLFGSHVGGDATNSSAGFTQLSLNEMTNDFDMSPTFNRLQHQ